MLIDMSLRYIKIHFLVSPTDRSGAPVNLALERAAFSNYRSNYWRSKLWWLARGYHYRAAITSFPRNYVKYSRLFIQNELHAGSIWSGATTLLASPRRFVMEWLLAPYTRFVREPSWYFLFSLAPFSLRYIKLDWTILSRDYMFNHTISYNLNIYKYFAKQRLARYTSNKLVEQPGHFN